MTFKELKDILHKVKGESTTSEKVVTPEVQQAREFLHQMHTKYNIARKKRMDNWFSTHPDKQYFSPTTDECLKEIAPDEWMYWFCERILPTPAQRYQDLKHSKTGWNHESTVHTIEEDCTNPACRFYPETGEVSSLEILADYRKYQDGELAYQTWKRLEESEIEDK